MRYTIGLDVGTASVGWAVINNDLDRIEDLGVRTFQQAENQKNGESLALPRRTARSARRRINRRRSRLNQIKNLFISHNFLTREEINSSHNSPNNPYEIRYRSLSKLISNQELFIAIYHITKRRGYKSNRKKVKEVVKDDEQVLASIAHNQNLLTKYASPGEMFFKDPFFAEAKRNKAGDYKKCMVREALIEEINIILSKQQELGNNLITEKFYKEILYSASFQRPFASGDDIKKKVGKCVFEKNEIRAPKASPSFQLFNFLQKINHIRIINNEEERSLSELERKILINKAYSQKEINFNTVRDALSITSEEKFNIIYFVKKNKEETLSEDEIRKNAERSTKIPSLTTNYIFKDKFEDKWKQYENNRDILDKIAEIFTFYKTDDDIIKNLKGLNLEEKIIENLLDLSFSKFGHLSLKAINQIIPFLEEGLTYDKACEKAGYDFKGVGKNNCIKLPPLKLDSQEGYSITNPVVRRSIAQTIKVVNAIIDQFGEPESINIELARDLARNYRERREIIKHQLENKHKNEESEKSIKENFKREPSGQDINKYKLYTEQNGQCLYSGKSIDENRLFDDGYTEVDHIIPFSRSFNDSYSNKALVLSSVNQNKLNRTPYEWMGEDKELWSNFEARVNSMNLGFKKKNNLLIKKVIKDDFAARELNDTRYISKFLKNYIQRNLKFADSDKKNKVLTINGQATAYIRKRLGLNKDREEGHKHHAQDAVITAVVTPSLIYKINKLSKYGEILKYVQYNKPLENIEDKETGSNFDKDTISEIKEIAKHKDKISFPEPWDGFADELRARISDNPKERILLIKNKYKGYKDTSDLSFVRPIFVSQMPKRKITGQAHKETLRSPKMFIKGEHASAVKIPITDITLNDLPNLMGGEKLLYKALKKRLEEFDDNPKKAFSADNPFYKPLKNGENSPIVRSLRVKSNDQKSGMLINNNKALVDQDSMVRIDIFSKLNNKNKDEYYIIPIYAYHFAKKELPNKVITIGRPESEWLEIDNSYKFIFSLYPGDLVKLIKQDKIIFGYYMGCNRFTAAINLKEHNSLIQSLGNGIKSLDKIEKYVVDMLGRCYLVKNEKRQLIIKKH